MNSVGVEHAYPKRTSSRTDHLLIWTSRLRQTLNLTLDSRRLRSDLGLFLSAGSYSAIMQVPLIRLQCGKTL